MTAPELERRPPGPAADGDAGISGFFAFTVARPVALSVVFATLIVLGIIAYSRLPLQLLPDEWSQPSVFVFVPNRDSSARENEESIARVIEEQLRTMTGIEEVQSWSDADGVQLSIRLDPSLDLDLAKAEVRDRLERARPQLPETVAEIATWSEDASQLPITFFGITLAGDEDHRDHLMDQVVIPRLEAVPGIGKVDVWGVLQDSVRILLDEDKVIAAQLDIGAIIRRLSADNFAMPLGELDDGGRELILRSDMRFKSIEEVAEFPIGDGLKLKDVGRVAKVKSVRDRVSRIDGRIAYYGMATKDSQANVVAVSHALKETIDDLEGDPRLAGDIKITTFFVQGDIIESALGQLQETALWGGALAVVVLFVFLRRVRLTLCVALSIPTSTLMALVWQYFSGDSLNLLTMVGITLAIGMLVDNAVVMVENIARVRQETGDGHRAAVAGSRQIALAVTLATLTTVVVFLPLIFMTENPIVRAVFAGIGLPLSVSLLASLLVAILFLPVISARILGDRPAALSRAAAWAEPLARLPGLVLGGLVALLRRSGYGVVRAAFRANRLLLALLAPLPVRLLLAAAAFGCLAWWRARVTPALEVTAPMEEFGWFAGATRGVSITVGLLAGLALAAAVVALVGLPAWRRRPGLPPPPPRRWRPASSGVIEMVADSNRALIAWTMGHRYLASLFALVALGLTAVPLNLMTVTPFGDDSRRDSLEFRVDFDTEFTLSESSDQVALYEDWLEGRRAELGFEHITVSFDERGARFAVYFAENQKPEDLDALERRVHDGLPRIPGHQLRFYEENQSTQQSGKVVGFVLTGPDTTRLEELGLEAARILRTVPGLGEVSTPARSAPPQVQVVVDREMALELGVDTNAVQQSIAWVLRGFPLPRYQEGGRDLPFLIEYDEEDIAGLPSLRDLSVFSPTGAVPLSSVADLEFAKGTRRIYRRNGQTSYTIEAKVDDPLQIIPITERAYLALEELELPRGYSFLRDDSALERQKQEFGELKNALILSIVLVFLVMGILFESVMLPISVLITIPFAIEGALWTLFLTGTPMDFIGWIGLIILAGVVVNNGIVLIDCIHNLRREGIDRTTAVIRGCGQRVRPVLMTALTTVCGLLPMIYSQAPQNGIDYRALATIVAGGLVASTFFTLWAVPLAYTVIDDVTGLVRSAIGWALRGGRRRNAPGDAEPGFGPARPAFRR